MNLRYSLAKIIIASIGFSIFLLACGGKSDATPPQNQNTSTTIKLDRTDAIGGIDSNNTGIRDDIKSLIALAPPENRKSLERVAKAYQNALIKNNNIDEAVQVQNEIEKSVICLSKNFVDYEAASNTLLAATANTENRFMALVKFESTMSSANLQDFPVADCNQ